MPPLVSIENHRRRWSELNGLLVHSFLRSGHVYARCQSALFESTEIDALFRDDPLELETFVLFPADPP